MKKRVLSVFVAFAMMLSIYCSFTSCSQEKDFPVTIGNTTIQQEPENIVVLDKNLADIVSCMEYDIKLVGRSKEVNQDGMNVVPEVGTKADPDVNKIKELKTDLVITDMSMDETKKKEFEDAQIPVIQYETAQTEKQLKNEYRNIGRVLGGNITGVKKGNSAYKSLSDTLKNIRNAAEYDSIVKTVCYLYIGDGVLKTMNKGTWGNIILNDTGAINVFENSETDIVDTKQLKIANPDFIFCSDQDVISYLSESDTLSGLKALEENAHIIPLDDITMQGYTSLDVLETMLRAIYPDQFAD